MKVPELKAITGKVCLHLLAAPSSSRHQLKLIGYGNEVSKCSNRLFNLGCKPIMFRETSVPNPPTSNAHSLLFCVIASVVQAVLMKRAEQALVAEW
eukprot:3277712-Amphidinium_carterae.2